MWLNLVPYCWMIGFSTLHCIAWHLIFSLASWHPPAMRYGQPWKTLLTLGSVLLMLHKSAGFQTWHCSRNVCYFSWTAQSNTIKKVTSGLSCHLIYQFAPSSPWHQLFRCLYNLEFHSSGELRSQSRPSSIGLCFVFLVIHRSPVWRSEHIFLLKNYIVNGNYIPKPI